MIRHTMAKTLSTLLTGCGVSLFPALSFGLGLGDIQIESRLNQPLYARIEIVDVTDEEWHQIRARIAPRTLLSEGAVHPEILESLTLRAVGDARRGHFIEVKSGEPLTEPLFDLPVEVAGQSLQVVRNYSVLLDPPTSDDASRTSAAALANAAPQAADMGNAPVLRVSRQAGADEAGGGETTAGRTPTVAGSDAQARVARHKGRGTRVARSSASHKAHSTINTAAAVNTAMPAASTGNAHVAHATNAAKAAEQQQLEGQLTSLQETLTKMQATIAAQDTEIAKLTAQITARNNSQAVRQEPQPQAHSAAADSEVADDDATDERPSWFQRWHTAIYWIAGVGAGAVLLSIGAALFIRRRNASVLREIAQQEAARRNAGREAAPKSDPLAWQSSLRAAQSGTWKRPSETASMGAMAAAAVASVETSELPDFEESGEHSTPGKSHSSAANAATVVATVAVEELTQDLQADLEALSASYEEEGVLQSSSAGVDAWRKQNAMLERDYLADTETLPFVLDAGNHAKAIETGRIPAPASQLSVEKTIVNAPGETAVATQRIAAANEPAMADAALGRGSRNREIVEILEQSLGYEPGRVDIQLKLLEIYHHEALGNRDNFDSLLRKLAADPQQLSPAQQLHVEMLQRTLQDGKQDTDSDCVADVAI